MAKKGDLIKEILKLTGGDPEKHVDRLSDNTIEYLEKFVKVIKALK